MDAAHATGLDETQWSAPAPSSPLLCARKQRARPSATYVREPPSRAAPLSEADSRPSFVKLGKGRRGSEYRRRTMSASAASVANRTSRSLVYGMSLLRQFTAEEPVRGIAELAEALDVSRPTAHRYASTCLELGYLEQAPLRRYRLARRAAEPGLAMLGSLATVRRARPILHELRQATGRTVSLAILDGAEVLYLQRLCGFACGQYQLEKGLGAGSRRPARRTAAGKALLAASGESDGQRPQRSDQVGLVLDDGGLRKDARGLAVAIMAQGEPTSAIEVTIPRADMSVEQLTGELGEPLRQAASALEAGTDSDSTPACVAG
jgi:DNA-binding IclR family transcriptional regulator